MDSTKKAGLIIKISGTPIPKQSFIYHGNGSGHTDQRVKDWQEQIGLESKLALLINKLSLFKGELSVQLDFILPDKKRKDLDNLSKAVLDSLNNVIWEDDSQITKLVITKTINNKEVGVTIMIWKIEDES